MKELGSDVPPRCAVWISASISSAVSKSKPTRATTRSDRLGQNSSGDVRFSRMLSDASVAAPKRSVISEPELGFRFKSPSHTLAGSWGEVDRILYA